MKKITFSLSVVCLTAIYFNCFSQNFKQIKDGVYEGRSQSRYKEEPYVGISYVYISKGKIDSISFSIVDTSKNEVFDDKYELHYKGVNEEYVQQCRNDWAGVNRYPKVFMYKQSLDEVDAVSGATWSCNMFKSSMQQALQKAKNNLKK